MTTTSSTARAPFTLPTPAGPIVVVIQRESTAYVRAGLTELDCSASEPLVIGRGASVSVRGHFTYRDGGWHPQAGFLSVHRTDSPRDATPQQLERVAALICDALDQGIELEQLHDAGREAAYEEATKLRDQAGELRMIAEQLDDRAGALERGGCVVYADGSLSSGFSERLTLVRTHDGRILDPVTEPPGITHSSVYRGHTLSNVRS